MYLPQLGLNLELWQGDYDGINWEWLRWLDADHHWIPTPLEQTQQQLEQAETKAARLAEHLRSMGIDPDQI